jgi:hypothetical protein
MQLLQRLSQPGARGWVCNETLHSPARCLGARRSQYTPARELGLGNQARAESAELSLPQRGHSTSGIRTDHGHHHRSFVDSQKRY